MDSITMTRTTALPPCGESAFVLPTGAVSTWQSGSAGYAGTSAVATVLAAGFAANREHSAMSAVPSPQADIRLAKQAGPPRGLLR